ncbi:hypothetical protein LEP1GSC116_5025 [Leptospira interrogans serovar Icterohaemorrhagiae str. Verdun HP]|uniref:Uncharacterized protein n=3 Tax=Leptospira interrogans TaxID=173 RepID=M6ZLU2_LEPIR|nr:hypothetical protein LEP1GSC158_4935 [Leptospira interrogans serovar Zanoni str. LT2156]EMO06226.1 hypothetical protein LEP1GSC116_5025 [Leptospira interrogans serovar Icterohaemorrhagiae str. Verdun HP]EMP07428.1 hypothetical protein LEP1GSC124_2531 [Leptospira interrogans serovar Pyrogenes str. 200701872]
MEIFFQSFLKHFDFFRKKLTQLENESFKKIIINLLEYS